MRRNEAARICMLTTYVSVAMRDKVDAECAIKGVSRSALIGMALEDFFLKGRFPEE